MDAREITGKGNAIQKAVKEHEPPENIINLLKELQTGVKPTDKLLRTTMIGKIVNKLKAHTSPEVASLANTIVREWKKEMDKLKVANGSSSGAGTPTRTANGTASPKPTPTPQPQTAKTAKTDFSVPPDKRTHKTDKIDIKQTKEEARNNCIRLMYDGLVPTSTVASSKVLSTAVAVEDAAIRICGDGKSNSPAYREKIRSLFQNLKNKSNPGLRHRILSGEVSPERFVNMTYDELKSEQQKAEDEKIAKENIDRAMVAQEEKSVSTSLMCGKCNQKQVSYTQAQTRSADEPMTTFCECMNCGARWKFS